MQIIIDDWVTIKKGNREIFVFETADFKKRKEFWLNHLKEKKWVTKEMIKFLEIWENDATTELNKI